MVHASEIVNVDEPLSNTFCIVGMRDKDTDFVLNWRTFVSDTTKDTITDHKKIIVSVSTWHMSSI